MHILLVDDEPENREVLNQTLTYLGHDVQVAEDGDAALVCLLSQHFDLLITDLVMPVTDGVALIREALDRGILTKQQIIAITGLDFENERVRWCTSERIMLLFKPFGLDSLSWALEALTGERQYAHRIGGPASVEES